MSKKGEYSSTTLGSTHHKPSSTHGVELDMGIYLGIVTNNVDNDLNGVIFVEIPHFHKTTGEKVKSIKQVQYCSPFAGITNYENVGRDETEKFENTQQTYGMWFPPPDIGNMVLVCFADGNTKHGYVLSHTLPPNFNQMIPGIPTDSTFQGGDYLLPTAEKNKYSENPSHENIIRPAHSFQGATITRQGLIGDRIRGTGTAGARRESPSNVFGILTKGPRDKTGIIPTASGHQFIMDDDPSTPMIRIRSSSGNQLLLDDYSGSIYMINASGKAWIEMDASGSINLFGEGDINLRAKKNFNLRAEQDINIEAGQSINIKAAGDTIGGEYVGGQSAVESGLGLPTKGTGGTINFHAAQDLSMNAVKNVQVTATGGDLDLNSAGQMRSVSGLSTLIHANTVGVQLSAVAGVVGISAPLVGIAAPATNISGGLIGLNSAPATVIPYGPIVTMAKTANNLTGTDKEDQPSEPPEYDAEGDVALTSGGKRVGKKAKISTIVGTLLTAEPYDGHAIYEPKTDEPESMTEDTNADKETGDGQIAVGDDNPADSVAPGGDAVGNGFKDSVTGAVDTANNWVDSAGSKIGSAIGGLLGKIPNRSDVAGQLSNFLPGKLKELQGIQNYSNLLTAFGIAIPVFRFPTGTAKGDKIIGLAKQLKEIEARLGQFSLNDLGLPVDINGINVKELKGKITGVVNDVTSSLAQARGIGDDFRTHADLLKGKVGDYKEIYDGLTGEPMGSMGITRENILPVRDALAEKNIDLTVDGPSLIFTDKKTGTKVVDISNGIGPIGTQLGLQSTLEQTKVDVSELVIVDLSDNQLLALVSFASHIGIRNFANSELLVKLNEGNYIAVPRLMKRWRTGKVGANSRPQVREDYIQRREYEIELFTTPDWLNLSPKELGCETTEKNASFKQLRNALKFAKEKKYIAMGIINDRDGTSQLF